MSALPKCHLCANGSDPRMSLTDKGGAIYPLCDGCSPDFDDASIKQVAERCHAAGPSYCTCKCRMSRGGMCEWCTLPKPPVGRVIDHPEMQPDALPKPPACAVCECGHSTMDHGDHYCDVCQADEGGPGCDRFVAAKPAPAGEHDVAEILVGDVVDYRAIIGGPITKPGLTVCSIGRNDAPRASSRSLVRVAMRSAVAMISGSTCAPWMAADSGAGRCPVTRSTFLRYASDDSGLNPCLAAS